MSITLVTGLIASGKTTALKFLAISHRIHQPIYAYGIDLPVPHVVLPDLSLTGVPDFASVFVDDAHLVCGRLHDVSVFSHRSSVQFFLATQEVALLHPAVRVRVAHFLRLRGAER
jgi:hypothetical protein